MTTPYEELLLLSKCYRALAGFMEAETDDATAYANFSGALEATLRRARTLAKDIAAGDGVSPKRAAAGKEPR